MNAKSTIRSYWDWRSQTYGNTVYKSQDDAKQIWKTALNDAIRTDKTNKADKTDKKLNVLDVGTGTGFLALIFAEMGHTVTGVDISRHMLEKSRDNADKMSLDVDFMHGDAENLPFEDETFDIVINRHLLWTIPNPGVAVGEWSRVVTSGGKLMLIDGMWHDSAISMRLRRFLGRMIVFMTEKRSSRVFTSYYARVKDQLPFFSGSNPDAVVDMFNEVGLKNVSVDNLEKIRAYENENACLSYKIANNPSLFMALGEK